jgi:hypothetical protein
MIRLDGNKAKVDHGGCKECKWSFYGEVWQVFMNEKSKQKSSLILLPLNDSQLALSNIACLLVRRSIFKIFNEKDSIGFYNNLIEEGFI